MTQLTVSEFRLKLYPKDFAAVRTFYARWPQGQQSTTALAVGE